ncbi:MAG: YbaB/EbfC family nucleoid-associated protein [Caulobacteraceae bacterium]
MKDMNALMKQAQGMQAKLQAAQARLAEAEVEGAAGSGLVRVTLTGGGELRSVQVDDSLLVSGEGEMLGDLIIAAHADAKRKIDELQAALMKEAMGPLAGMPGMPGLKF